MVGNLEIDDVALLGGLDIYSKELDLTFHQPRIRDIATFGTSYWNSAINLFLWTKDKLDEKGKEALEKYNNFECIYLFAQQADKENHKYIYDTYLTGFFILVFPDYSVQIHQKRKDTICLYRKKNRKNSNYYR